MVKPLKSSHYLVPGGDTVQLISGASWKPPEQNSKPRETAVGHRSCAGSHGRKCGGYGWLPPARRLVPLRQSTAPAFSRSRESSGFFGGLPRSRDPPPTTSARGSRGDAHASTSGWVPELDVCVGNRPVLPREAAPGSCDSVCFPGPCFWPCLRRLYRKPRGISDAMS